MSETPRTDEQDKLSKHGGVGPWVPTEFARTLERELEQEKKWKVEDPRMLRDQIRVADLAFNGLNERHNEALAEIARLKGEVTEKEQECKAWEESTRDTHNLMHQVEQLKAQLAECQAARARLSDPVVDKRNAEEPA